MSNVPSSRPIAVPKKRATTNRAETGLDVAARYFVYKLYDDAGGRRMQWQVLYGMGESATSIARAVERGWVVIQEAAGKPLERRAALTDEGQRLGRRVKKGSCYHLDPLGVSSGALTDRGNRSCKSVVHVSYGVDR
jgi:hypothetical protein